MNSLILDKIPFQIDIEQLWKSLRIKEGSEYVGKLQRLVNEAQAIGKPKAFYKAAFIETKMDDQVVINGTVFTSRVLRVNLDKVYRVFPFVATCGVELEAWSSSIEDMLQKYWVDVIKEMALRKAIKHLQEHLIQHYSLVKMSRMNPGSLPDWPLQEQQPLFAILGKGTESIGIQLTDHCLMIPVKSVSGIWFPAEVSFENCRLCPREKCPGRRAPYDQGLFDRKYRK
jgi:hypothetical protein